MAGTFLCECCLDLGQLVYRRAAGATILIGIRSPYPFSGKLDKLNSDALEREASLMSHLNCPCLISELGRADTTMLPLFLCCSQDFLLFYLRKACTGDNILTSHTNLVSIQLGSISISEIPSPSSSLSRAPFHHSLRSLAILIYGTMKTPRKKAFLLVGSA